MTFNTRRNFVRSIGIGIALGLTSSASGRSDSSQSDQSISDFEITGEKVVETIFNEDRFKVKITYRSSDLKGRKGQEKFSKTKTIDRPLPNEDDFPLRGKRTTTEPWHTHMATESEWQTVWTQEGISTQHSHEPTEDNYCGIGLWTYEEDDGDYYSKSPINIVCEGYDVEDVEEIFVDEGWYSEHAYTAQWPRYAWDVDREIFVGPDNEPQGGYSHAVNKRVGVFGRMHGAFWELEDGIVSIQAHQDGNVPDHSTGLEYNAGRDEIADILLNNGGVDDGYMNLNNGKKDHSGYAKVISGAFDSINRSC